MRTDSLELRLQQSDRFSGSCVMEHNPQSNTHTCTHTGTAFSVVIDAASAYAAGITRRQTITFHLQLTVRRYKGAEAPLTHLLLHPSSYSQEGREDIYEPPQDKGSDLERKESAGFKAHRGILKSALIGWRSDRGGSPSPSSMAVMPNDQTSQRAS